MKATQDNAEWVSNTYKQGSSEDNWAVASASYRVPRSEAVVSSSTTTSLTVLTPTGGISASDSVALYNSTDGTTDYSAVISSTEYPGSSIKDPDGSGSETVVPNHTYWSTTGEGLCAWNKDGSRCLTIANGGIFREYSTPRNWDIRGSSNEGPTLETTHTPDFGGFSTPSYSYGTAHFANNGLYFYVMTAEHQYVYRWTLSTAYDLSTAGSVTRFNVGEDTSNVWVTLLYSYNNNLTTTKYSTGGFCGLGFSTDGKKGIFFRRDNRSGGSNEMDNLVWSFELSTPYDLDSVTSVKYNNIYSTSTSYNLLHGVVSPDGKIIYGVDAAEGSSLYVKRHSITAPWDVTGGVSSMGSATVGSGNHQSSNSYAYTTFLTVPPDGVYYSLEQNRYHLANYSAEPDPMWPRTVLDITSASQTVAPTNAYTESKNISGIKYLALTRQEVDDEGVSLAVSGVSTNTSLTLHPDMSRQGSTSILASGDVIELDGTPFTLTADPTFTDNWFGNTGSYTVRPNSDKVDIELEETGVYIGSYQIIDPATTGYGSAGALNSYASQAGFDISQDGKKMFMAGFANDFGGDINIDNPIAEFDLSTPFDPSTATLVKGWDAEDTFKFTGHPAIQGWAQDFQFNDDGTKIFAMHRYSSSNAYIAEYTLSTPYDLSTLTYVTHVDAAAVIGEDYVYAFAISPDDGKGMQVFYSGTTGSLTSSSNCDHTWAQMTTAWSISSMVGRKTAGSAYGYRGCVVGDGNYGYIGYSHPVASGTNYNTMSFSSISGNFSAQTFTTSGTARSSTFNGFSTTIAGTYYGSKIIVRDNNTKMFIHFPQTHSVMVFSGTFGHVQDRHVIDTSSLGLGAPPQTVRLPQKTNYTSMGSTSLSTTTDTYKEYETPEVSIDAEALRFKIEGDTDAEVTRFNVDLFT